MRRANTPPPPPTTLPLQPSVSATAAAAKTDPTHPSPQSPSLNPNVAAPPQSRKRLVPDSFEALIPASQRPRPSVIDQLSASDPFRTYSTMQQQQQQQQMQYAVVPHTQSYQSVNNPHLRHQQQRQQQSQHHHHSFANPPADPQTRLLPQLSFGTQRHGSSSASGGRVYPGPPQQQQQQHQPQSLHFHPSPFDTRQFHQEQQQRQQPQQQQSMAHSYAASQSHSQHLHQQQAQKGDRLAMTDDNTTALAAEADAADSSAALTHDSPDADPSKRVKGLRHFSRCVAEKVQLKGATTYNEVADELVDEFTIQARNADSFDHKNIRRRVYDALNVLMAMGIIAKAKKEIRWIGLPTEGAYQRDLEVLQRRNKELRDLTATEREAVNVRVRKQQRLLKNLVERNAQTQNQAATAEGGLGMTKAGGQGSTAKDEVLRLPFLLLRSGQDARVKVESNEDGSQFVISFTRPFVIVEDMEVLTMLCDTRLDEQSREPQLDADGDPIVGTSPMRDDTTATTHTGSNKSISDHNLNTHRVPDISSPFDPFIMRARSDRSAHAAEHQGTTGHSQHHYALHHQQEQQQQQQMDSLHNLRVPTGRYPAVT
ncbi:E2F/DP family winged-helix DNA-binding domain-containing protein [Powellomyces hirtus]|nr:E2F/DP family winged-helix DNA-binding domain-containing protein [Powellomyces hirtus]